MRGRDGLVDIELADGRIAAIEDRPEADGSSEIDAEGSLGLPGFVDGHVHLDKRMLAT